MTEKSYKVEQTTPLLEFLLAVVKGQSRNNIKGILARGQVLVDDEIIRQFDHPLRVGQLVTICPPKPQGAKLPFPVLYEDDELLVIDKPAGLLSMANENEKMNTSYHIVTDYVRQNGGERIFIVHRLDRDTSGVLLFAKNEEIKRLFQDNWEEVVKKRGYVALVQGKPEQPEGIIRSKLRETRTHLVYTAQEGQFGLEAITGYRVMQSGRGFSLLEIDLQTGRKNQIRVHMADSGHPIVGDKQYGAKANPIGRLGLHANVLEIAHPKTGKPMRFNAPVPVSFKKAVSM